MPVIGVYLAYLVHLQHAVFCILPNVLAAISQSLQHILDDAVGNIVNLSSHRIRIHLPAEDDVNCVVPGEVSVSNEYKVCYISISKQLVVTGVQ